jgi:hypothetical protein
MLYIARKLVYQVGRTPWSAADAPSASLSALAGPDQGSDADEGVRPTSIYVLDFRVTRLAFRPRSSKHKPSEFSSKGAETAKESPCVLCVLCAFA